MHRLNLVFSLFVAVVLTQKVGAEMHSFSLEDGRALEAEIVDYNRNLGKVTLKRPDGKRIPVPTKIFVEEDQSYIQAWAASNAFLSDGILNVKCDDEIVKTWKEEQKRDVTYTDGVVEKDYIHNVIKSEDVAYSFIFNNTGGASISGLVLEYCIYYEQSDMAWEAKPEILQKTMYGSVEVPNIPVKVETVVATKPVMIYEDDINEIDQLDGDQRRPGKGKVRGVRARLYMKSDKDSVREFSNPSSLSLKDYPWTTKSSSNKRPAYRKKRK
jgi:hypothetical protein